MKKDSYSIIVSRMVTGDYLGSHLINEHVCFEAGMISRDDILSLDKNRLEKAEEEFRLLLDDAKKHFVSFVEMTEVQRKGHLEEMSNRVFFALTEKRRNEEWFYTPLVKFHHYLSEERKKMGYRD